MKHTKMEINGPVFEADVHSRKGFNGFIYETYGKPESNDFPADVCVTGTIDFVEVFDSPDGLIVAIHDYREDVHVIRPVSRAKVRSPATDGDDDVDFLLPGHRPAPEPDFVDWTDEDDKNVAAG